MELSGNTVLITGGSAGIGRALAEGFLKAGSEVIICGRGEDKLQEAKDKEPRIHARVCDVGEEADRIALFEWVTAEFPQLNILINNAGIQRRFNFLDHKDEWKAQKQEIAINLDAPIHLSSLFVTHFLKHEKAAVMNVSSGLAFVPAAFAPIYSATKAAIHSFTLSLRHQLSETNIKVIDIVPPAVNTNLGGPGLHTFGVPVHDFVNSVLERIQKGETEIGYGFSEESRLASREELIEMFKRINSH